LFFKESRPLRTYKEALAQWKQQQNSAITFSVATPEEAQGIYDVIASLWGTLHTTPVEIRLNWYQKNPAIDYIVKKDDIAAGYITIMPLKHETIEKLMEGKLRGWDIKAEDILPFTPGVPLECFTGIAVRAGVKQPKKYGMRLLMGIMETMLEFAREGIFIKRLYAVSDIPDGVKLSRDLGFEETPPAPGSTFGQFVLDLQTSNSPYAEEYRRALNTKESQNGHQTEQHENTTSSKPRRTKVAKPTITT
jgi:hypothetical protein